MSILTQSWKQRTSWLVLVSLLVGLLLTLLTFTDWAEGMRIVDAASASQPPEGDRDMPAALMIIAPFIKEFVLIGIPLAMSLAIGKFYTRFTIKRT
jgi:hypothetical protein